MAPGLKAAVQRLGADIAALTTIPDTVRRAERAEELASQAADVLGRVQAYKGRL